MKDVYGLEIENYKTIKREMKENVNMCVYMFHGLEVSTLKDADFPHTDTRFQAMPIDIAAGFCVALAS